MAERVLVTGAGGFIGHHMVKHLVAKGYWVRGADLKHPEFEPSPAHEFELVDLRHAEACLAVTRDVRQIYHLASDLALGYVTADRAKILRNNTVMDVHILEAARLNNVRCLLFTSSACIYPQYLQAQTALRPPREDDAWPADPEEGQGLQKLYTEKLCQYYTEDFGLETRVVRLHNIYGPLGRYEGGQEKAPAAICRKVALADHGGVIDVWGDGRQTRSFMYVDDCVEGLQRLMCSDCPIPVNLDTGQMVTIDELVSVVARIAGKKISIRHNRSMPQGARGCSSDSALSRHILNWQPRVSLPDGVARTYAWIAEQLVRRGASVYPQTVARASVAATGRLREPVVTAA
jgi:nucleoside-diphosphate-sugar epimerase